MRENPQEAIDLFNNHHEVIDRIMMADFRNGKRDEYLGGPYVRARTPAFGLIGMRVVIIGTRLQTWMRVIVGVGVL
jgi:hypothetical protein